MTRSAKAAFYGVCSPLMALNAVIWRNFRTPAAGVVKVHLGPGQTNYLPGWINVDANMFTARCDIWADLRRQLPFRDNTVDVIYSHHLIEHLPDSCLGFHFAEMYRCLKPGGVFRVGGPNADIAMRKYVAGEISWFTSDFPDKRDSLGGKFANFILCRGEHLTILTPSYVEELAHKAGFERVYFCTPKRETNFSDLIERAVLDTEWTGDEPEPHTLIAEGRKE